MKIPFFKKILALLLLVSLSLTALCACGKKAEAVTRVGFMTGPTGMGMAKMIADGDENYSFTAFSDVTLAQSALISGSADLVCLPTNNAAALYAKTNGAVEVLAVNCLGSLYIVCDASHPTASVSDLEGQTIYASVPNSTTGPILGHVLSLYGVHADVAFTYDKLGSTENLATHDMLTAALLSGDVGLCVMPEPKVSAVLIQAKQMGRDLTVALDLSVLWSARSAEPLTMGCIVARKDYADAHAEAIDAFLSAYAASVAYIAAEENRNDAASRIVDAGVLPKLPIATASLGRLAPSLVCLTGDEMKRSLKGFYAAIGIEQPDDGFYYEK